MSYAVKFGEYYLRYIVEEISITETRIVLSKELMRGYKDKSIAETIAKKYGGKVIEIKDEVTNEEMEGQTSLFDMEG